MVPSKAIWYHLKSCIHSNTWICFLCIAISRHFHTWPSTVGNDYLSNAGQCSKITYFFIEGQWLGPTLDLLPAPYKSHSHAVRVSYDMHVPENTDRIVANSSASHYTDDISYTLHESPTGVWARIYIMKYGRPVWKIFFHCLILFSAVHEKTAPGLLMLQVTCITLFPSLKEILN